MRSISWGTMLLAAMTAISAWAEVRTWRSADGQFQTSAELVELVDTETVRLKGIDGREFTVKLGQLSQADRDFVANFTQTRSTRASYAPQTATSVEVLAKSCGSAAEAVAFYEAFYADTTVPTSEKDAARLKLQVWQALAATDAIRAGLSWLSSAEAEKGRQASIDDIRQGLEFLRLNNGDLAKESFERASKSDPTTNNANFIMGLVYAVVVRDLNQAESQFRDCIRRDPQDITALNNLSLVELKQRNFPASISLLREAVQFSPKTANLSQNLGRLIDQAGKRRIAISPVVQSDLGKLYSQIVRLGATPLDKRTGWVYMLPRRRVEKGMPAPEKPGERIVSTGGTGVVVAPGIVLTLRSTLGRSQSCLIALRGADGRDELVRAEMVELTGNTPFALLSCPQIKAEPVVLSSARSPADAEVRVFGYTALLQDRVEAASARGRTLPGAQVGGRRIAYDLEQEVRLLGGPVCDVYGNVVALHSGNYSNGKLGLGLVLDQAMEIVKAAVPGFQVQDPSERAIPWSAAEARIRESTVIVYRDEELMHPADLGMSTERLGYLEDIACFQCWGSGQVECPVRSCNRGSVLVTRSEIIGRNTATGGNIVQDVRVPARCDTCNGSGRVTCRVCSGSGNDPELKQ